MASSSARSFGSNSFLRAELIILSVIHKTYSFPSAARAVDSSAFTFRPDSRNMLKAFSPPTITWSLKPMPMAGDGVYYP